jgi:hypothetical protein
MYLAGQPQPGDFNNSVTRRRFFKIVLRPCSATEQPPGRRCYAISLMLAIDKAALELYCLDGMPPLILRHGFGGN